MKEINLFGCVRVRVDRLRRPTLTGGFRIPTATKKRCPARKKVAPAEVVGVAEVEPPTVGCDPKLQ